MKFVSIGSVLTVLVLIYLANTIWSLTEIFIPPNCSIKSRNCYASYLASKPNQALVIFTSLQKRPLPDEATKVYTSLKFDYLKESSFVTNINIPLKTRRNGTLYMHISLIDENKLYYDIRDLMRNEPYETIELVTYMIPKAATFNLLNEQVDENRKKEINEKPVSHILTDVAFSIFTDNVNLPSNKIPGELYPYIRFQKNHLYSPIVLHNILKTRLKNVVEVTKNMHNMNVTINYSPISFGSMRLMLHMKHAFSSLQGLGFGEKDVDDVKGVFADTNLYLLSITVFIASFHMLFDFLAFKNDVSFWRQKKSMAGLSMRTVLWRAFSQCVIFLFLVDQYTSLLVLIPAGISSLIELWKSKKVLHIKVTRRFLFLPWLQFDETSDTAEQRTRDVDAEAMRYLCYLLYPLCIAGAVYSLVYEPHKSWYSWCLNSVVNGVYAFGFLFMLPQLFVNYRLKSVAALPWRAFMYKAFNTFIDDVFAFIITMPTAHRVACFRDDIVFLVYLYQRWLYPVDLSRTDESVTIDETIPTSGDKKND